MSNILSRLDEEASKQIMYVTKGVPKNRIWQDFLCENSKRKTALSMIMKLKTVSRILTRPEKP